MSPLIGIVLLVGGTVLLMAVVGPFVLSATGDVGADQPDADLRFAYSEDVDPAKTDSYGVSGDASGADGLLTITLEDGEALEATRLNITGAASGGALTAASYTDGDTVDVGDSVTVWVNRGDELEVVWNDQSSDRSAILDSFTIFPQSVGPGVPDADYDCSGWSYPADFDAVSGITADSNDLVITDVVLDCDLSAYAPDIPNVEVSGSDGGIIGNVEADGNLKTLSGAGIWGDFVETTNGNNVELSGGSIVNADVVSDSNLKLDGGSTIVGEATLNGDFDLQTDSEIDGDLNIYDSDGVDIDNSVVGGDINVNTDVEVDADNSLVGGDINLNDVDSGVNNLDNTQVAGVIDGSAATGDGTVKMQNGSAVAGITTEGPVELLDHSTVRGDLATTTTSDSKVNTNSTVKGTVTSNGKVILNNDYNSITDGVEAGDLDCKDSTSTVDGELCSEYAKASYAVSIDSVTTPIPDGSSFTVDATVTNTGYEDGSTQTVELLVDGLVNDTASVQLNARQDTSVTFTSDALSSGTYNLTVASEDDWREETGEVTGSVPPEFTSLDLRLTKVTGAGDVQRAEFDYNIQYGNPSTTIEFLLNKSGSTVDAATRTGTGEIWEWDHSKQAKPITYRINITSGGGECYEIDVPTSASEGDTYDVTSAGTSC